MLTAQGLSLSFGGPKLFENVDLEIRRGEKVFLIGPNGCGKTSLFKILLGQYAPDTGFVRLGAALDLGYYEQSQQSLHDEKTVMDEIWDEHPQMTQTQVRNALAVFLFTGEEVFKAVGALSGGERARVLLLKLMLSKANFLLLDEPTNHLDISYREAREDVEQREQEEAQAAPQEQEKAPALGKGGAAYKERKARESQLRKKRTALKRLEAAIEENEAQAAQREAELQDPAVAADYERVTQLSEEIAQLHQEGERLLEEWSKLSTELEEENREAE